MVEPFLAWRGLFWQRHEWDDDARQKRISTRCHGKGSYASHTGNCKAKQHERRAHMVGPECIQPLGQASANCILNSANDVLYLTVALAVASRQFLVDDSEHFAKMCKAPFKFRSMVRSHILWFSPSVHDVLQELCCSPAM